MTESPSTPRLRATFAIYLALVAATPLVGPREIASGLSHLLGIAGFACVTLACLGRVWCSLFIAGHKDETLVTSGPYACCRHPLYSFSILGALGMGFASKSLLLGAAVVLLVAGLVTYAASCEEQFLEDAFAEKFKVDQGWTFVTGEKGEIDALLASLGASVANKNDHTPMILIGNDTVNYWTRAYGLSPPSRLVDLISAAAGRK